MSIERMPPSRVVIELQDGKFFATAWSNRAMDTEALPLPHFFTGRLIARIVGTENYLRDYQIKRVLEEVVSETKGTSDHTRIVVQRRAPNVTPQGRKLLGGAANFVDRLQGVTLERVDAILDDPVDVWDGWNGAKVYSDGQYQVVLGGSPKGFERVLSVASDDGRFGASAGSSGPVIDRRRLSGRKADRRRPLPTSVSDFIVRLKEYGFKVDDGRRHYSISHECRPGVASPIPRTPSDHRWADNFASQVKQIYGIDVRQSLEGN